MQKNINDLAKRIASISSPGEAAQTASEYRAVADYLNSWQRDYRAAYALRALADALDTEAAREAIRLTREAASS